jgi:predicted peptidase
MRTKFNIILFSIVSIILLVNGLFALAQSQEVVLPPVNSAFELLSKATYSTIAEDKIEEVATEESKKHTDDGYLAHPKVTDCFDALGYRYTGGLYNNDLVRFRLRCPPKMKLGKKYPLIIWFHGRGESGNDNERQLAHIQYTIPFIVGTRSLDFFMLATQCPENNPYWDNSVSQDGKGDAPFTIAMEIFDRIIEEYPIDKTRISIFGQCSGATAAWMFARKYPKLCAAIVPISARPPSEILSDVTISAYNCIDDPNVSIEPMRNYVKRVNQNGGIAHLTEIDAESHDAWSPALSQNEVVAWMITQKKNSIFSPPPGIVLKQLSWKQVFIYYGLPICCLLSLIIIRLFIMLKPFKIREAEHGSATT